MQPEARGQFRRNALDRNSDLAPMNVPVFPDLLVDVLYDRAGNGEADPFASSRLRKNERVDSHDVAARIKQRPSTDYPD